MNIFKRIKCFLHGHNWFDTSKVVWCHNVPDNGYVPEEEGSYKEIEYEECRRCTLKRMDLNKNLPLTNSHWSYFRKI